MKIKTMNRNKKRATKRKTYKYISKAYRHPTNAFRRLLSKFNAEIKGK